MAIPDDLLNALKDYKHPEDLIGETGPLKQLTKQRFLFGGKVLKKLLTIFVAVSRV